MKIKYCSDNNVSSVRTDTFVTRVREMIIPLFIFFLFFILRCSLSLGVVFGFVMHFSCEMSEVLFFLSVTL